MSWQRISTTITREIEIEVIVLVHPGEPQTWTDPGDPGDAEIESATLDGGESVELTKEEVASIMRNAEKLCSEAYEDEVEAMHDSWQDQRRLPF